MPEPLVISNTSPVFYLHQISRLEVLRDIYGTVVVPPGVEQELEAGGAKGRKIAELNQLKLTGTLGVLLRAKAEGLVAELAPLLADLKARGMRMSDPLMQRVLAEAEE
jgi:predicted nucleic acid-binding protein